MTLLWNLCIRLFYNFPDKLLFFLHLIGPVLRGIIECQLLWLSDPRFDLSYCEVVRLILSDLVKGPDGGARIVGKTTLVRQLNRARHLRII